MNKYIVLVILLSSCNVTEPPTTICGKSSHLLYGTNVCVVGNNMFGITDKDILEVMEVTHKYVRELIPKADLSYFADGTNFQIRFIDINYIDCPNGIGCSGLCWADDYEWPNWIEIDVAVFQEESFRNILAHELIHAYLILFKQDKTHNPIYFEIGRYGMEPQPTMPSIEDIVEKELSCKYGDELFIEIFCDDGNYKWELD